MKQFKNIKGKIAWRRRFMLGCTILLFVVAVTFIAKNWIIEAAKVWLRILPKAYRVCKECFISIRDFLISTPFLIDMQDVVIGGIFMLIGVFCAFVAWFYRSKKTPGTPANNDKPISLTSDTPIKKASDDAFCRGAYVRMLSTLVMTSSNLDDARYVGIFGQWGEGKTSALHLLEERIKQDYGENKCIFMKFYPWEYPESIDLRMLFFEQLANAVAKHEYLDLSKVARLLVKHFETSRFIANLDPVNDIVAWFRQFFSWFSMPYEELTDTIKKMLRNLQQRIIVVVDDLDRLSKEETCRVIRFLKANGDLPNITYLILADEDYLANAVASLASPSKEPDIIRGRKYLEKIIPLRCPLPQINEGKLLNLFQQDLVKLLNEYGLEDKNPQDSCDWLLLSYLTNARNEKQLINTFSIKLATYKRLVGNRAYLGVHIGDLLALTVIEIFDQDLYKNLRHGYSELLYCTLRNRLWGLKQGLSAQWMEEQFYSHGKSKRETIERFLQEYIGITHSNTGKPDQPPTYELEEPQDSELLLHYRLASQYCFPNYFYIDDEPRRLLQDEIEGVLKNIRDGIVPKNAINELDNSGMLHMLLHGFEVLELFKDKPSSDCYIKTLIYMADLSLKDNHIPFAPKPWGDTQSPYIGVFRCLLFYCQEMNKSRFMNGGKLYGQEVKNIGEILLPLLSNNYDVVLTAHIIKNEDKSHHGAASKTANNQFFSAGDYEKLCKLFLERIEKFQRNGRLVGHTEFFTLFWCWRLLLRRYNDSSLNERFKSAWTPMTSNIAALDTIIIFFCNDNHKSDNYDTLVVAIKLDELTDSFGDDGVESIRSTLESAPQLLGYTCKALVALRWALEQKENNKPYDPDVQMKILNELYETEKIKAEMQQKVRAD